MRKREAFGDRRLADAGLADQRRIVLGSAGKDLDGAADLLVAADDRIELAVACRLGEIAGELLERVVAIFGAGRVGAAASAQFVDRGVERVGLEARIAKRLGRVAFRDHQSEQQPLDGDIGIAGLGGDLLGLVQHPDRLAVQRGSGSGAGAGNGRDFRKQLVRLAPRRLGAAAGPGDQAGGHALLVFEQGLEQMRGRDALMVHPRRDGLSRLQEAARAIGEFFEVHAGPACSSR